MIKKIIAYSFILTAGFIMLAHDLVPHHHHEMDAIVQLQTYSSNAEKEHQDNFPEHKHEQEDYLFIIRQALILSTNRGSFLDNKVDRAVSGGLYYFLINTPDFLIAYSSPDYKFPFCDNPQNFISNDVAYSFGLRAPPTV